MTSLLPDVTISGTLDAIVVHNNTNKTIVGYVMRLDDGQGRGQPRIQLPYTVRGSAKSLAIPPGDQFQLPNPGAFVVIRGQRPFVNATLGAVLFDDGEVVGAEREANLLLTQATDYLNAEMDVYATLMSGGWGPIQQIASQDQPKPGASVTYNIFAQSTAKELVMVRDRQGETATFEFARKNAERDKAFPMPWRRQ
jgi:hypothetical protein